MNLITYAVRRWLALRWPHLIAWHVTVQLEVQCTIVNRPPPPTPQ